jgi:hypothetical protein
MCAALVWVKRIDASNGSRATFGPQIWMAFRSRGQRTEPFLRSRQVSLSHCQGRVERLVVRDGQLLMPDNTIALFDENLSHHRRLIAIVWRRQRHCSSPRRDASIGGDLVTWTLGLPSAQPKARRKRRKPATFHARAIDCAVDAWSNERSLMERYQCTQQFSKVRNAHARLIEQALLPKPCNRISRGFLHRP